MAHLHPIPFAELARRMVREAEISEAVFDLPDRKWWVPDPQIDLSALHFSRKAGTPVGPAAGPHTQLAQNIVLAWLAGGRIMELKTVQVNDRIEIPRPCIHAPNVGFNVEWSQELRVEESLREYAKAAYLIEILKSTRALGRFPTEHGLETVFDISVGYDIEGIRSEKVTGFLRGLMKPEALFEELRGQMTGELAAFRDLAPPSPISDCVTLSTFHGCPPAEIETIAQYLLEELGLHVILKLNPTLLGYGEVRRLLHERLGYTHLELRQEAFEKDLQYEAGIEMVRRLRVVAEARGSTIGAKFTNTLVVGNEERVFPSQPDPYMYLSGPPLHVLSMNLMQRFREDLGFEFPVSFSAGIDATNFPAAVACGMVPVTTCTDLLRQGGFGRLPGYLKGLRREVEKCGVSSREAFVLAAHGNGGDAVRQTFGPGSPFPLEAEDVRKLSDLAASEPDGLPEAIRGAARDARMDPDAAVLHATWVAGRLNGRSIVPPLEEVPRYHIDLNRKAPRRIDSVLALYDCINCDLCISACPNDAIFAYSATPVSVPTGVVSFDAGGITIEPGSGFNIAQEHQLAVFSGACNECSNCEVYCPEEGAPFREKERVFPTKGTFASSPSDGFWMAGSTLRGRIGGRSLSLEVNESANRAEVESDDFRLTLTWDPFEPVCGRPVGAGAEPLDTALLWRMRTAWEAIYGADRPNPVTPDPREGRVDS